MKKVIFVVLLCLIAAGIFSQRVGDRRWVNVQSANLKASAGFFAANTGALRFGDEVTVTAVSGKWVQVRSAARNVNGWITYSSLTSRPVVAQGGSGDFASRDITLAARGFNPDVEREHRRRGGAMNYEAVDQMESVTVSDAELLAFIQAGRLQSGE